MNGSDSPPDLALLAGDQRWLTDLARRLVQDAHAAEDLVQETWLRAVRDGRSSPSRSWLARVLRNLAVSGWRERSRRAERERNAARPDALPSTAELSARVEAEARLAEAVLALGDPYAEVLLLQWREELSISEIARRQGVSEATVRSRASRARARLRESLGGERGDTDWRLALAPLLVGRRSEAYVGGGATGVQIGLSLVLIAVFVGGVARWGPFGSDVDMQSTPEVARAEPNAPEGAGGRAAVDRDAEGAVERAVVDPIAASPATGEIQLVWLDGQRPAGLARDLVVELDCNDRTRSILPRRVTWDGSAPLDLVGLEPGAWNVRTGLGHWELLRVVEGQRTTCTLDPGELVQRTFEVVDAEGAPVGGAQFACRLNTTLVPLGTADRTGRLRTPMRSGHGLQVVAKGFEATEIQVRQVGEPLRRIELARRGVEAVVRLVGPVDMEAWLVVRTSRVDPEANGFSARLFAGIGRTQRVAIGDSLHVAGLKPGSWLYVESVALGMAFRPTWVQLPKEGRIVHEHALVDEVAVAGRFAHSDGSPVVGGEVRLADESRYAPIARTDAQGRYRLGRLAAGARVLEAALGSWSVRATVEAKGPEPARWDPTLENEYGITVQLVDPNQRPLRGEVTLHHAGRPERMLAHGTTDPEGRLELRSELAGPYMVKVGWPLGSNFRLRGRDVVDGTNLVLVLDPAVDVEGLQLEPVGPDGAPLRYVRFHARRADGAALEDGRSEITVHLPSDPIAIEPGIHRASLWHDDLGALDLGPREVPRGGVLDLGRVEFERPAWVRLPAGVGTSRLDVTDLDGGHVWDGVGRDRSTGLHGPLQPGRYRLTPKDHPEHTVEVVLVAGEIRDLE